MGSATGKSQVDSSTRMAYPYQRHDSLQFKIHHSFKGGVKQYKRWTPLIALAALIFLAFLVLDSRKELLLVRSPDASQSIVHQTEEVLLHDHSTTQTDLEETESNLTQDLVTDEEILLIDDPAQDRLPVKPAQDLVTEHRTEELVTENRSEELVAENRTEELVAENRPEELVTENRLEEVVAENRPEEVVAENRTESELATEGDAGESSTTQKQPTDKCDGRRIFVYDLPSEFNDDLAADCAQWKNNMEWFMCDDTNNNGFNELMNLPPSDPMEPILKPRSAWYKTDQFSLEIIMHKRLTTYPCTTQDPSQATAFYIPFYHGLDLTRYIYNSNFTARDHLLNRLMEWLRRQEPFQRLHGHRHVLVLGRIVWDFIRCKRDTPNCVGPHWGSPALLFPETFNMTKLFIERSPWPDPFRVAIPYPTSFHPASETELEVWKSTVRASKRLHLASYAGAMRGPGTTVRGELAEQCGRHSECNHLVCSPDNHICHESPQVIYKLALESVFCLQPPGDSPTRKGIFDSLLCGCIPVLFAPNQTVEQYLWHLPGDSARYMVMMSDDAVVNHMDVMKHLKSIPVEEVAKLQENVLELLPRLLYRNPELQGEYKSKDAFDVVVDSFVDQFRIQDPGYQG